MFERKTKKKKKSLDKHSKMCYNNYRKKKRG